MPPQTGNTSMLNVIPQTRLRSNSGARKRSFLMKEKEEREENHLKIDIPEGSKEKAEVIDNNCVQYWRLLLIPTVAILNLLVIFFLYYPLRLKLGLNMVWSLEDAKQMLHTLQRHIDSSDENVAYIYFPILALYSSVYVFFQTFGIPGSILLNAMSGAVFGTFTGTLICSVTGAAGCTLAYSMIKIIGKDIIQKYFHQRINKFNQNIESLSNTQTFLYLLALRVFPFTPQWFLNVAAPILGIELWTFFLSLVLGLLPFHYVTVKTGKVITKIESTKDIIQFDTFIVLAVISALLIIPSLLKIFVPTQSEEEDTSKEFDTPTSPTTESDQDGLITPI